MPTTALIELTNVLVSRMNDDDFNQQVRDLVMRADEITGYPSLLGTDLERVAACIAVLTGEELCVLACSYDLCPIHLCDAAICDDDDPPECRIARS